MKTAILTQPLRTNYGGILQNYALQQTLKSMGHEVYTLDKAVTDHASLWKILKRAGRIVFGKMPASYLFYEKKYKQDYSVFTQHTRAFVNRLINLYLYTDLREDMKSNSFDAYVVGSDQVWRRGYGDMEDVFLGFTRGWEVKRVAYAASFGVDKWEYTQEETEICAAFAKQFDAVSMREASGVSLCKDYLGVSAVHVLDPSMLLTKEQYIDLVDMNVTTPPEGQLFVHVLDKTPEKKGIIKGLANKYKLKPFTCNQEVSESYIEIPIERRIQPPVEQWLRSFLDAEYVVTDSFHATVFSILFNKRFLVLGNPERGLTRIQSLLEKFGLEDCLITDAESLCFPDPDYADINNRIEHYRKESLSFLINSLR